MESPMFLILMIILAFIAGALFNMSFNGSKHDKDTPLPKTFNYPTRSPKVEMCRKCKKSLAGFMTTGLCDSCNIDRLFL